MTLTTDASDAEKQETNHPVMEPLGEFNVVQTVHTDGTVDYVDALALGGDAGQMPKGYFWSVQFIGTVIVSVLGAVKG